MMNIGTAAKKSGLSVKTVRFYSDIGIITPDKSSESNYRIYSNKDVEKLLFVGKARKFDFSIEECRELLSLYENKDRPSSEVKKITLKKIKEIEQRMSELDSLRTELKRVSKNCNGDQRPDCPIIGFLAEKNRN
tara:strand:- start:316 stop:717 length:402 start_codon:yes stop_codon:yes gene_type:complete